MEDYSKLEGQIGDLGGEEQPKETKKEPLKKLKHNPNQTLEELTPEEDAEMKAFLNRSRSAESMSSTGNRRFTDEEVNNSIEFGWVPIKKKDMGIRAQFYPEDWQFRVRPAKVAAIKNWSAIDEDRIDNVNDVFNEIIKSCVSITSDSGNLPWSKINSWDRFWFILKVREYTFAKGESKIEFKDECPECGQELTYNLTPESLYYEFPDDSVVDKHWQAEDRIWYIDPKDYEINHKPVKLYVPTLEKDAAILNWAIQRAREKKSLNEVFIKFLPWMLAKVPKDEQVLNNFIKNCEREFNSWDVEMFAFMDEVLRNIIINPSEKLRQVCPHCGEEVTSNVKFPSGVKSLFAVQNKHKKFGTK